MSKYLIETDNGKYEIEVEDSQEPTGQPNIPQPTITQEQVNIPQIAEKALDLAVNPVKPLLSTEAQGVGQGAIQAVTGGYGMPTARTAVNIMDMLRGEASSQDQVPQPTPKENIVGNVLGAVPAVVAGGYLPQMGKGGTALAGTGAGALMNPSDKEIVPLNDTKRIPGAILGGGGAIAGEALGALGRMFAPRGTDALKRALKPTTNQVKFTKNAEIALPEIQNHITETGKTINNLEDFWNTVQETKNKLWNKVSGKISEAGGIIKTDEIKSAINNSIPQYTVDNELSKAQKIMKFADNYKKELTPMEAEHYLERVNKDLAGYYQLSPGDRYKAMSNEELIAKVAEANSLRNSLYKHLENIGSPEVTDQKKTLGALMDIGNTAGKRINVANRQQPVSLQEALNYAAAAHDLFMGNMGAGLIRAVASKAFKRANDSNILVKRAVDTFGKTPKNYGAQGGIIGSLSERYLNK